MTRLKDVKLGTQANPAASSSSITDYYAKYYAYAPTQRTSSDNVEKPRARGRRSAATWCQHATEHELKNGGKPWSYLLIPHDAIDASKTLAGLIAAYRVEPS